MHKLNTENYQWKSELFRNAVAAGRVEGVAEAVLAVLAARGVDVPDEAAAQIRGRTDLETLERWLRAAATAARVEDVLGGPA